MDRRHFLRLAGLTGAATVWPPAWSQDTITEGPQLPDPGSAFTCAIIADPQVGHADDNGAVASKARAALIHTVAELNAMTPQPAFTLFLGDLVNVFDEESVANFEACIKPLRSPVLLVHGNHDTHWPFEPFLGLMQRVSQFSRPWYSFDAGAWHFVALPTNIGWPPGENQDAASRMFQWLEDDLAQARRRPTAVFEHYHLMPQGLTQLEWYTFPLDMRRRLVDALTRHGNVQYCFCGHVHNGLQTSVKTAWNWRGIKFITVPTGIQSRNFGEEYPEYRAGIDNGGYYLLAHADGDSMRLEGRLAGIARPFHYPRRLRTFEDAIEPRWFHRVTELPANATLQNGDFDHKLHGWNACYRYEADEAPGFIARPARIDGARTAYICTTAKEPASWANDEMMELYQIVAAPSRPGLHARYRIETPPINGGGWLRLVAMAGDAFKFLMLFRWGQNENKADILVRSFGYAIHGTPQGWTFLQDLAAKKQGFYWQLPANPGAWHTLTANIPALHDAAAAQPGAYQALGIDKLLIALGTWANRDSASTSGAHFTGIALQDTEDAVPSQADGVQLPTDATVFQIGFGQDLAERQKRPKKKKQIQ